MFISMKQYNDDEKLQIQRHLIENGIHLKMVHFNVNQFFFLTLSVFTPPSGLFHISLIVFASFTAEI